MALGTPLNSRRPVRRPLAELSATGAVQREYVWLNGLPLAVLGAPDGATPSPVAFDQIVDNQPATSLAACLYWTKKRDSSAEGGDYLVMGTGANNCNQGYTWTTTLPTQGIYEVYVKWFGSTPTGQTSFRVDGEYLPIENAGKVKGSWVKLKTLAHAPGTISVTKDVYFAPTVHWADAIRVVLVGQDAQDHSRVAYIHSDHLGTPLAMTDKNQRVIWRAEHEPFGQATLNTDPDADGLHTTLNLRFPGQYADAETGLHYNYFRDYDPELGRYIESDPIGLLGGVNTFGYVGGRPLGSVDPLGWTEINYFAPDDKSGPNFYRNSEAFQSPPGVLTVAGHGAYDFMQDSAGKNYFAPRVAEAIRAHPEFASAHAILLLACNVGAQPDGFAQQLANLLGLPVVAPDSLLFFSDTGRIFADVGRSEGGKLKPSGVPGEYEIFDPESVSENAPADATGEKLQ